MEERKTSFEVVENNYGEDSAVKEAGRGLQCDLRMKISSVKFPRSAKRPRRDKNSICHAEFVKDE
jgi:hypothetical protein